MIPWLLLAVVGVVIMPDPSPGLFYSKERSRQLACEHTDLATARDMAPGRLRAPKPRGDFLERDTLVCRERVLRRGLRAPRDEVILDHLSELAPQLAASAVATRPDLADRHWLVQVYYPNPQVAAKLDFAAKNALMSGGVDVSDRTPLLSATDVRVITSLEPTQAYAVACQRYVQTGGLGADDALLAIVSRDPQETTLHAGLCADGRWSWLR